MAFLTVAYHLAMVYAEKAIRSSCRPQAMLAILKKRIDEHMVKKLMTYLAEDIVLGIIIA